MLAFPLGLYGCSLRDGGKWAFDVIAEASSHLYSVSITIPIVMFLLRLAIVEAVLLGALHQFQVNFLPFSQALPKSLQQMQT